MCLAVTCYLRLWPITRIFYRTCCCGNTGVEWILKQGSAQKTDPGAMVTLGWNGYQNKGQHTGVERIPKQGSAQKVDPGAVVTLEWNGYQNEGQHTGMEQIPK